MVINFFFFSARCVEHVNLIDQCVVDMTISVFNVLIDCMMVGVRVTIILDQASNDRGWESDMTMARS